MGKSDFVRAKSGFLTPAPKGRSRGRAIKGGEVLSADDPIVKHRRELFEPVDTYVEQATKGPGELRALKPKPAAHVCEDCEFKAKTAAGLAAHERSHDSEDD